MGLVQALRNIRRLYRLVKQVKGRYEQGEIFVREYLRLEELVESDETVDQEVINAMYAWSATLSLIGQGYADMMGIEMTDEQRKVQYLIGALAVAHDRLCDDLSALYTEERLDSLFDDPLNYQPIAAADTIARELFIRLLELMPRDQYPEYHKSLKTLHEVQKQSRKQAGNETDPEEIFNLTIEKGKYAMLAKMHALNPHLAPGDEEYQAIASLGYFQIIDDILDRYSDTKNGISTPANTLEPTEVTARLETLRNESFQRIAKLPYDEKSKDWFMFNIYVLTVPVLAMMEQIEQGRDYAKAKYELEGRERKWTMRGQLLRLVGNGFRIGFRYDYADFTAA